MYSETNFKTKKELKEAVASGKKVGVFMPGGMFPCPQNGTHCVEGPHYPEPHRWYATVSIKDGIIEKVIR